MMLIFSFHSTRCLPYLRIEIVSKGVCFATGGSIVCEIVHFLSEKECVINNIFRTRKLKNFVIKSMLRLAE